MRPESVEPFGRKRLIVEIRKSLPIGFDWTVVENSIYVRIPVERANIHAGLNVVKISPTDEGHQNHWSGMLLEVFTNRERLDGAVVRFDGLLERAKDDRPDYVAGLHIWLDAKGEEDWYIARPESLEPLIRTVNQFIKFWCKEG
jgi:hypothetical protein